jgi:TolB-like protein
MNLFEELRHRNVFKVAAAYAVVGWLLAQVADLIVDAFNLPDAYLQMIIILLVLGFPVALLFAWVFELTPDGVRKAKDLPADMPKDPRSGRFLKRLTIGLLIIAVAWLGWDKLQQPVPEEATEAPAVMADKSIAVLPFADFSPDGKQGWFADGLTDEILNALARTSDLRVASRTSSFQYRNTQGDLPRIATELGVAHILEGSVRRAGDKLRVTAQLIRAMDDTHLWSETVDGTTEDSIAIQEQIALKIAQAMETAMDPDELERMLSAGTSSVEAWELYVRADVVAYSNERPMTEMVDLLERAIAIDPSFVDAHLGLAQIWMSHLNPAQSRKYEQPISRDEARRRFYEAITNAQELARSEVSRAEYDAIRARFDVRLTDYLAAMQRLADARPERYDARAELASAYILIGDYDAARRVGNEAKRLAMAADDPSAQVFQFLHRVDLAPAMEMAEVAVARPNAGADTLYQAHRVFLYAGEIERAARLAQLYVARATDESSLAMVEIRQACAEGRVAAADAIYASVDSSKPGWLVDNQWLFLQTLGRYEDAVEAVRYLDEGDGLYALSGFLHYTHFDPRPFPNLIARLEAQGIQRPPPTEIPFACRRD